MNMMHFIVSLEFERSELKSIWVNVTAKYFASDRNAFFTFLVSIGFPYLQVGKLHICERNLLKTTSFSFIPPTWLYHD